MLLLHVGAQDDMGGAGHPPGYLWPLQGSSAALGTHPHLLSVCTEQNGGGSPRESPRRGGGAPSGGHTPTPQELQMAGQWRVLFHVGFLGSQMVFLTRMCFCSFEILPSSFIEERGRGRRGGGVVFMS